MSKLMDKKIFKDLCSNVSGSESSSESSEEEEEEEEEDQGEEEEEEDNKKHPGKFLCIQVVRAVVKAVRERKRRRRIKVRRKRKKTTRNIPVSFYVFR